MKKLLLGLLGLVSTVVSGMEFTAAPKIQPTSPPASKQTLILTPQNLVVLNDEVNSISISKTILQLQQVKAATPVLFIRSPGGSVFSGMQLVESIVNYPRPIICIGDFFASMAFSIFQSCHSRVVMNSSYGMQHKATMGADGTAEQLDSFFKFLLRGIEIMELAEAKRIGITYTDFKKKIENDWWLYGEDIVKEKVADTMLPVMCNEELSMSTTTEDIMTIFGTVTITMSKCPLSRAPLDIKFSMYDEEKRSKAYSEVIKRFENKKPFRTP